MIEIFRYDGKWRIRIIDETLEFMDMDEATEYLIGLLREKQQYEPYDNSMKKYIKNPFKSLNELRKENE